MGDIDLDDILGNIFGGGFSSFFSGGSQRRNPNAPKRKHVRINVNIDFNEAVTAIKLKIVAKN